MLVSCDPQVSTYAPPYKSRALAMRASSPETVMACEAGHGAAKEQLKRSGVCVSDELLFRQSYTVCGCLFVFGVLSRTGAQFAVTQQTRNERGIRRVLLDRTLCWKGVNRTTHTVCRIAHCTQRALWWAEGKDMCIQEQKELGLSARCDLERFRVVCKAHLSVLASLLVTTSELGSAYAVFLFVVCVFFVVFFARSLVLYVPGLRRATAANSSFGIKAEQVFKNLQARCARRKVMPQSLRVLVVNKDRVQKEENFSGKKLWKRKRMFFGAECIRLLRRGSKIGVVRWRVRGG